MLRDTTRLALLSYETERAFRTVRERVEGLTDDEFWWSPVPEAWTIRQRPDGRWAADYEEPDPVPAPFTTMGWRVVHLAECKIMYHEYAFGRGRLTWPDIDSAHTAMDALAQLDEGHALLMEALGSLTDEELEGQRATNWGEQWPTWMILWTMIQHDLHHGGEIGLLRDLYRTLRRSS